MFINAMFIGRGSGHTLPPTIIGIIRLWGCWVGAGYLLALYAGYGPTGIWTGISLGNILAGITSLIWLKYGKWTKPVIRRDKAKPMKQTTKPTTQELTSSVAFHKLHHGINHNEF